LGAALSAVFGANITGISTTSPPPTSGKGSSTTTKTVAAYLQAAATDYSNAQAALDKGDLGLYQADVEAANHEVQLAQNALGSSSG
jgi:hypothetical protein